ncbi:MAG: APC family permease [Pyrinomonadaceae bacterium]
MNTRGLKLGKLCSEHFHYRQDRALLALIALGLFVAVQRRSGRWQLRRSCGRCEALWQEVGPGLTAATGFGLFVAVCVAQTNSLFSADAWNNITFTAGEVKNPRRNIPLSLASGTLIVISLYLLANLAYLVTLPLETMQTVPNDRVASATAESIFPGLGAGMMAVAIMVSTFGCNNGLILAGARAYYAMARDGLFFGSAARSQ